MHLGNLFDREKKFILDFNVKKSFQLVLDCDAGTLGFIQNGVWLGVAHSNLKVTCLKWSWLPWRFERGFPFLTKIDLSYREVFLWVSWGCSSF